jgi:hypothetical protein
MFNISTRKVGGLRFIKIGRLTFMWCVSRQYKSLSQCRINPANSAE